MKEEVERSWERFLNPESLRANLMMAAIFVSVFEMLKDSIVSHIRNFFTNGFDENGAIVEETYETDVLARNKSVVFASLDWLRDEGVISNVDIELFKQVRNCRNEIAHEMMQVLTHGFTLERAEMFNQMVGLLDKIERWWIVNVEIPTNPDFDDAEIDEEGIIPGPLITIRLMIDIALSGGETASTWYFEQFKAMATPAQDCRAESS